MHRARIYRRADLDKPLKLIVVHTEESDLTEIDRAVATEGDGNLRQTHFLEYPDSAEPGSLYEFTQVHPSFGGKEQDMFLSRRPYATQEVVDMLLTRLIHGFDFRIHVVIYSFD